MDTAASLHAILANETQEEILKAVTEETRKYTDYNTGSYQI
jgi:hypothetical protein